MLERARRQEPDDAPRAAAPEEDSTPAPSQLDRHAWQQRPPILHELIWNQARRTPDAIACVCDDRWVTLADLAASSGTWAAQFRRLGVIEGRLVALLLDHALATPALLLGVLAAGGVCVPLEPSDPPDVLAQTLAAARPQLIVTRHHLQARLPLGHGLPVLLGDEAPPAAGPPVTRLESRKPAFVLFSSGSTGAPKGVVIPHRAAAARMSRSAAELPDVGRCMAIMKTPLSKSPILSEIFAPLLHGCYFVIARPEDIRDVRRLGRLIVEHAVTHLSMTVATLRALLDWNDAPRCTSISSIYCGGETVTDELQARCAAVLPQARLIVTYGTTEAGHALSCDPADPKSSAGGRIGTPIANAVVRLLDSDGRPCTNGQTGEICLGGPRLALGYLGQPLLTARQFIPDPVCPGERLYRTGDLAVAATDGSLTFYGRSDQQVKIRGHRVDLHAVEAALSACPDVREAAVVARPTSDGHVRLVAYYVAESGGSPLEQALRRWGASRLPDQMVPSAFVRLNQLPRTLTGKLDRAALPTSLDSSSPADPENKPTSETEQRLLAIWRSILEAPQLGPTQNFFDLGGDSLLAIRMVLRVEAEFGRMLPLDVLFERPTVRSLAELLDASVAGHVSPSVVPIKPGDLLKRAPLFVTCSLHGELLFWERFLSGFAPDQTVLGLPLPVAFRNRSQFTMHELAGDTAERLDQYQPTGAFRLAGYSFGGHLAFEIARQLTIRGRKVNCTFIIDTIANRPPPTLREWLRQSPDVLRNSRFWLTDEFLARSKGNQARTVLRFGRRLLRSALGRASPQELPPIESDGIDNERIGVGNQLRRVLQQYVPQSYSGKVVLLRNRAQPLRVLTGADLGWSAYATRLEVIEVTRCRHFQMVRAVQAPQVARSLQMVLDR